jgi:hypothetical protein
MFIQAYTSEDPRILVFEPWESNILQLKDIHTKKIEIMAQTAGQIKPFGFMTLPLTESIYHCLLA